MRKQFRVVSIREQKVPSGTYLVLGLQGEEPPEKQGAVLAQFGQNVPKEFREDVMHSLGPLVTMLEGLGGGILSDFVLRPEEYRALGSPNVGQVLKVDMEVFKE